MTLSAHHRTLIMGFFRAVAAGTLAGGGPWLLLTVPFGLSGLFSPTGGRIDLIGSAILALFPIMLCLPCVLFCSIVVGLPATLIASRLHMDNPGFYGIWGGITGPLLIMAALHLAGADDGSIGLWAGCGGISGCITGISWGSFRERLAREAFDGILAGVS